MAGVTAVPGAHGHAGRPSPGSRPEGRGAWLEGKPAPLLSGGGQLSCVGRGLETAPSGHSGGTGAPGAGSHPRGPAAGGQQRRQEATCHQAVRRGCSLQHSEHKTRPVWRKLETFFTSKDLPNSGAVCCGNLRLRGGSRPASPGFWEVWQVCGRRERQKGGRRSGDWPPTRRAGAGTACPAAGRTCGGHRSLPGGLSDVPLNVTIPLIVEQTRQARQWIIKDTFEPAPAA